MEPRALICVFPRQSSRVGDATLLSRIHEVQRLVSAEAESKEELLQMMREQCKCARKQEETLNPVEEGLVTTSGGVWEVLASAKKTLAAVVEMKDTLASLTRLVISAQVLASNFMFLRPIDPTRELPVTLEDSLGRLFTFPPEWIEKIQWKVSCKTSSVLFI
jgi:hypothetical protein